jgi:hypothetical protein
MCRGRDTLSRQGPAAAARALLIVSMASRLEARMGRKLLVESKAIGTCHADRRTLSGADARPVPSATERPPCRP